MTNCPNTTIWRQKRKYTRGGYNEYCFKINGNSSEPVKIERTIINTKPFFRDLTKPLLLKNEFNPYNIDYVVDNTRKSEDFGGDNHVYMYYDRIEDFELLLQVYDITPNLSENKIVFLFGEEDLAKNYPLNFQGLYNILYDTMPPKPVRVEEIQRLFLSWMGYGYSGNGFLVHILDNHHNLLTTPTYSLSIHGFMYLYANHLQNKTAEQGVKALCEAKDPQSQIELAGMFAVQEDRQTPLLHPVSGNLFVKYLYSLFPADYTPTAKEWCAGFYIAYAMAEGRNMNSRIVPAIVMNTHGMGAQREMKNYYGLFQSFKYFRALTMIRRPVIAFAAAEDRNIYALPLNYLDDLMGRMIGSIDTKTDEGSLGGPIYTEKDNPFLPYRRAVRFEDLKLQTKATLEAICDFLDIEWDNSLFFTTANGGTVGRTTYGPGSTVTGYDKKPVYNLHERAFNKFDYYRMEILLSDGCAPWGYKPMFYKGDIKYSEEEILKMFEIRFNFENYHKTDYQLAMNEGARAKLYDLTRRLLKYPYGYDKNGEKLVPIPWLKPKEEFIEGELYE